MTNLCLSCHLVPAGTHPYDVFPYFDATPPPTPPAAPTSVLPLFDPSGQPNQDPSVGGLVCSTCHDPHEPSFPVYGLPKFLRIGASEDYTMLCSYCHQFENPPLAGADLVIPSRSNSVTFERMPDGSLNLLVTVQNRGNSWSQNAYAPVSWEDQFGARTPIGTLSIPPIAADSQVPTFLWWPPPPDWTPTTGFFVFDLPLRPLNPDASHQFIRSINAPPPPQNLRVVGTGTNHVDLTWDPPFPGNGPATQNVYRNGVKVNPTPLAEWVTFYQDSGVAPGTPATYTVEAVGGEGFASPMSNRVGALTTLGAQRRVPQDYPTIQDAVSGAGPGTTVLVAPGTYTGPIAVPGSQITIKGQDANGCIVDLSPGLPLSLVGSGPNTLSGFTIVGGQVQADFDDTISEVIFRASPSASLAGGGFVTNSVFDGSSGPSIDVQLGNPLTVANSIFLSSAAISAPPMSRIYLLNNRFSSSPEWQWWPGENNSWGTPPFIPPGPPDRYFLFAGPEGFQDAGADVGLSFLGAARDIGVFEIGEIYTARPATNLAASWSQSGQIRLTWSPSPDDDLYFPAYEIYRSGSPEFPGLDDELPYNGVPNGVTSFDDGGVTPGLTYYYRVRAVTTLKSCPTNTVSVTAGGHAPVAQDDSSSVDEDGTVFIEPPGVLLNDSDPDGETLTAVLVSGPLNAMSFFLAPDGAFGYTPLPNFCGTDTFSYYATDGFNLSSLAIVTITVNPVNDLPGATADSFTVDANVPNHDLDVLLNDTDADGTPLAITNVGPPDRGGAAVIAGDRIAYSQATGFVGIESFAYEISDGQGGFAAAVVTVNVANDPPVAGNDAYVVDEDNPLSVPGPGVLGNDADPNGYPLAAALYAPPAHAQFFVLRPDGSFDYVPNPNFSGADSFVYVANDGLSDSNHATVTITVGPVNDPPLAQGNSYSVLEDTSLDVTAPGVLANDGDPDGDALTAVMVSSPANGDVALNPDGSFSYTPAPNFSGTDSFTYAATDGPAGSDPATVTITVIGVNDAPIVENQAVVTNEDNGIGILLAASDPDGDTLTFSLASVPLNGDLTGTAPALVYTPRADFHGTDSFSFFVDDGAARSNVATVSITVSSVNDPPVVVNPGPQTSNEGNVLTLTMTSSDPDGDALSYGAAGLPGGLFVLPNGDIGYALSYESEGIHEVSYTVSDGQASTTVVFTWTVGHGNRWPVAVNDAYQTNEDALLTVAAPGVLANDSDPDGDPLAAVLVTGVSHGALTLNADGSFSYLPAGNFSGTDSFTYCADDGPLCTYYTTTVTLIVNPVDDAPVADGQNVTTAEDAPVGITLTGSDVESDPLAYAVVTAPANGTLSGAAPNLTYVPNANFNGSDSFTFTVNDGLLDSSIAIVSIVIDAVPDVRVASIAMVAAKNKGDVWATASVQAVDDSGAPLAGVSIGGHWEGLTSDADSGATGADGLLIVSSDVRKNPTGTFRFVIDTVGKAGYVFDAANSVPSGSIVYPPPPANQPPVAQDDTAVTEVDTAVVIAVLANDSDPEGNPLAVSGYTQPAHGSVAANPDQTMTYTPAAGFAGSDSFTYTAGDGNGGSDAAVVTVTVGGPPPTLNMHVASIAMSLETASGKTNAVATVTVVDSLGAPVGGVTVNGNWSGAVSETDGGSTNGAGSVELRSTAIRRASGKTFTFTVGGLVKAGWAYDDGANAESSDSITAP